MKRKKTSDTTIESGPVRMTDDGILVPFTMVTGISHDEKVGGWPPAVTTIHTIAGGTINVADSDRVAFDYVYRRMQERA